MTNTGNVLRKLFTVALLYGAFGCQESHRGDFGSESHFLTDCDEDADCAGLECIANTCTQPCRDDGECAPLAADGMCVTRTERVPGWSQICSLACQDDAACQAFGEELTCLQGHCVPPEPESPEPQMPVPVAGMSGSIIDSGVPTSQPDPVMDSRGLCDLETPFEGDEACIPPPAESEGIQIRLGPSDYEDSAAIAEWITQPGAELFKCVTLDLGDEDFPFASWEISARPGIHHSVHLLDDAAGRYEVCVEQPEGAPLETPIDVPYSIIAPRARMFRQDAAPENAAVARRIAARTPARSSVHAFNFTDKPLLIELWINLYRPVEAPVQYDVPLRVGPGSDVTFATDPDTGDYGASLSCTVGAAGRLLELIPLTRAKSQTVEVALERANGEQLQLLRRSGVYDDIANLWHSIRFDSVTSNPAIAADSFGGYSGVLDVAPGDVLRWSCMVDAADEASPLCDLAGAATADLDCQ